MNKADTDRILSILCGEAKVPMPSAPVMPAKVETALAEAVAPFRPGHSRRGEHEELLAATLASGIISAANQNVSPEAAVSRFREVLAVLKRETPHG